MVIALLVRATSKSRRPGQALRIAVVAGGLTVRDNLVTRELRAVLNEVFILIRWPLRTPTAPTCRRWATRWPRSCVPRSAVRSRFINVIVPLVNYDQATQDWINAERREGQYPSGRTARQNRRGRAKANEILAASVSNDPNVLVSKCLDAAREADISPLGCRPNTTAVPTVPSVTFGVLRYAWSDFCGTILVCCA